MDGEERHQTAVDISWREEALWALMWALSLVGDLPPDELCSEGPFYERLAPGMDPAQGRTDVSLRPVAEIAAMLHCYYCLHWHARNAQYHGQRWATTVAPGAVLERRHALEWLCQDPPWEDVDLGVYALRREAGREREAQEHVGPAAVACADLEPIGLVCHQRQPDAHARAVASSGHPDPVVRHDDVEEPVVIAGRGRDVDAARRSGEAVRVQHDVRRGLADGKLDPALRVDVHSASACDGAHRAMALTARRIFATSVGSAG